MVKDFHLTKAANFFTMAGSDGVITTKEFTRDWRQSRLIACYELAQLNALSCEDTKAHRDIMDLVVRLQDHEGNLTVVWNVYVPLVPQSYKDCFAWAWDALNEPKENVEHEYEEQSIF